MIAQRTVPAALLITFALAFLAPVVVRAQAGEDRESDPEWGMYSSAVRFVPFAGLGDEDFLRSIADRVAEQVARAKEASDPVERADLLLSSANLILAYELEPASTTALLGFGRIPGESEEATIRAGLDRADKLLSQAHEALQVAGEERGENLRDRHGKLEALARAMRGYLTTDKEPEGASADRRGATRLSVLLEDSDPRVAAAATLWQACLRSSESKPERALSLLEPALADPRRDSLPYSFFGRLLRCRLIASQGGYSAALALLTQMEDLCEEWMSTDADRADALRAVTHVEMRILGEWYNSLDRSTHAAERKWCDDRRTALFGERFGEGDFTAVLRLKPAIPILDSPPEAGGRARDASQGDG